MNRLWREVLLGAVTCATAAGAGAVLATGGSAYAQEAEGAPRAAPARPGAETTPPAPAPQTAIARIRVEGNQRIETNTILSYLLVRPGETFDPDRIDSSLKTLFATGLFADVQIAQRDADLVVQVVENPIVSQVIFEGAKALSEEDLEKEVQAKARSVFTAARAQADVQRIIELYRRSGRFAATVTPQVRELSQNRVDLIFEIEEGPVTGVRSVNFIGNRSFSDRDLREAVVTEPSRWWKFFSRNDNYDPDRLEYDREQLRKYYTNRGYADFRVVSAVAELTPDQEDFFITFTVDEGEKYEFGEVKVETELKKLSGDALRAVSPIQTGRVYESQLIEDSIESMTFAAGSAGYANVEIRPRIERDRENRKVNLVFEVNEGPRVFIERIDIVGNTQTVDPVIRRELRFVEGDSFNQVLLERSRGRVRALGFFKDVEITDEPGTQADRANIQVKVEEEPTGELAFAAGFSSTDSFLFDVAVTQRNLRGRGQLLRVRASTSQRRQQIDMRFTEPRFLGRNLSAGADLFSLRTDFLDEASFENQSSGFALRSAFPITDTTSLGLNYQLRQDNTEVDPAQCVGATPALICAQEGEFVTSAAGYAFNWDRRNDPVRPTRGFDLSIQQDLAGLGGEVNYLRNEIQAGIYRGLLPNVVASFSINAGYVLGWGGDDVRINDRFFKGGSTFRGFDVAGIGPRQIITVEADGETETFYQEALGGNAFAIGTLQVEIPLGLPRDFGISGALFTEFGALGILDDAAKQGSSETVDGTTTRLFVEDDFALRASAGLSIFWDSPFGPVQFDFAQPFERQPYDRTETFRFSQRTRF